MNDPTIPEHLRDETAEWVRFVLSDYDLESHHVKILFQAAECLDRIIEAREVIASEGSYYRDRFNQPRVHPAVDVERNNRIVFARLVRELNLSAEEFVESRPPALKYGG